MPDGCEYIVVVTFINIADYFLCAAYNFNMILEVATQQNAFVTLQCWTNVGTMLYECFVFAG